MHIFSIVCILYDILGVIHTLRNHQEGGGFRNDYANEILALSNAEFDYGRGGGGLETGKKLSDYVIYVNGPLLQNEKLYQILYAFMIHCV